MKKFLVLLSVFVTSITFAQGYVGDLIPQGRVNRYVGNFSDVEKDLKERIFERAIEKCGSLEKANLGKATITLKLSNIYKRPILDSDDTIMGSYPTAGANVFIRCSE
jgi:hypothetical protein